MISGLPRGRSPAVARARPGGGGAWAFEKALATVNMVNFMPPKFLRHHR